MNIFYCGGRMVGVQDMSGMVMAMRIMLVRK